jgi:hypothetical protein
MVTVSSYAYDWPTVQRSSNLNDAAAFYAVMMPPTFASTRSSPELRLFFNNGQNTSAQVAVNACSLADANSCTMIYSTVLLFDEQYCERIKLVAVASLAAGHYTFDVQVQQVGGGGGSASTSLPFELIDTGVPSSRRVAGAWLGTFHERAVLFARLWFEVIMVSRNGTIESTCRNVMMQWDFSFVQT